MEIAALIFSVCAFGFSLYCFIDIMAQKRSTHKIQVVDSASLLGQGEGVINHKSAPTPPDFTEFDDPAAVILDEMGVSRDKKKKII